MRDRILEKLGRFVVGHPWWVLAGTFLVTIGAVCLLPHLDIFTSRTAMYPKHMEVNLRFHRFLDDVGTTGNLIAVLEGEPDVLGPFAETYVAELRKETEVVSDVFYKADIEFFADRAFLFLSLEQLSRMRDKVKENESKVEEFGSLNGLMPLLDAFSEVDSDTGFQERIDIGSARQILAAGRELFVELEQWLDQPERTESKVIENLFAKELSGRESFDREGYLRSHDRKMMFLFIQPTSADDNFEFVHELVGRSRAAAERARDTWLKEGNKAPPSCGFAGLPANSDEEMIAIRRDVVFTASVAAVAILLIILIGFRSLRRGILVFIPLVLAGLWNMGLTALTVGHLTILTSGFTAILFGLGVDYGIFVSGRIEEGINRGLSNSDAIAEAVRTAGRTLLTAGGTTMMAFFVIGTVEFTGFAELGIVAGTGVGLVMIATLFVLPALSTLISLPARRKRTSAVASTTRVLRKLPLVFTGTVTFAAIALAAFSAYYAAHIPVDFDLRNIMPKNSESVRLQGEMGERSDFQPEFAAVMADDLEEVRVLAEKLSALPTVARVESIAAVLPEDQEKKVRLIRDLEPILDKVSIPREGFERFDAGDLADKLEELLDPVEEAQERAFAAGHTDLVVELEKIIDRMDSIIDKLNSRPELVERVRAFEQEFFRVLAGIAELTRGWTKVGPIGPEDLPGSLRDRFVGKSGRFALYVFPKQSIYDVDFLDAFLSEVYEIAPEATGFPSTHQVFSRMIVTGFRQATVYAIAVVFLLLFVDLRRIGYTLVAVLPLTLGGAWMFGVMYFLRIHYNYANIIALPLVIGLAVDYGVYITHRLREQRQVHPFATMETAAKPVVLAALTTAAGIGAICLGEHRGAASLGEALIYGIITCLVAAIVVLPTAVAFVRDLTGRMRREKSEGA